MESLDMAWQNPTFCILILLSILTLWIGLARLWQIRWELIHLEKSHNKILPELTSKRPLMAKALNESLPSHCATSLLAMIMDGQASIAKMDRLYKTIVRQQKRGLWILASIGTLSPFVGLLGTVFGVMHAFFALGIQQEGNFALLSAGLGEALITTAGGLFVGIEAVAFFNMTSVLSNHYAFRLRSIQGELAESCSLAQPMGDGVGAN